MPAFPPGSAVTGERAGRPPSACLRVREPRVALRGGQAPLMASVGYRSSGCQSLGLSRPLSPRIPRVPAQLRAVLWQRAPLVFPRPRGDPSLFGASQLSGLKIAHGCGSRRRSSCPPAPQPPVLGRQPAPRPFPRAWKPRLVPLPASGFPTASGFPITALRTWVMERGASAARVLLRGSG